MDSTFEKEVLGTKGVCGDVYAERIQGERTRSGLPMEAELATEGLGCMTRNGRFWPGEKLDERVMQEFLFSQNIQAFLTKSMIPFCTLLSPFWRPKNWK